MGWIEVAYAVGSTVLLAAILALCFGPGPVEHQSDDDGVSGFGPG